MLCTCAAALMWMAYPPVGIAVFALAWPAALTLLAAQMTAGAGVAKAWRLYAVVGAVGLVRWLALNFWLMQVTEAGLPALSLYGACYDVLLLWALVRVRKACGAGAIPWALITPIVLAGVESLRSLVVFDGYPWFRAGHPLADWPVLVQMCDLGGEVLATMLVGSVAGALVDCVRPGAARRGGAAIAVTALVAAFAYGAFRLGQAPTVAGPGILAIQTNVPTSNKVAWKLEQQVADVGAAADLTLRGAIAATQEGRSIWLAAWPETMMGGYGFEPDLLRMMEEGGYLPGDKFQRLAANLSARLGAPLLVGSPAFINLRKDGDHWTWDRQYNSAYLVTTAGLPYVRYDKLFLAPFGETMPYIRSWPWLQQQLLSLGASGMKFDLSAGTQPVQFQVPWNRPDGTVQNVRVAAPICFEDAMSWVCRDLVFPPSPQGRVRRADVLMNMTNDGWFGWYDGGRAQHAQIARFRCIETRTPMVRIANTGMTVAIDSSGRTVNDPLPMRQPGWLYSNPPLDQRTPLFALIGDAVSWLVMAATSALIVLSLFRKSRGVSAVASSGAVASSAAALASLAVLCTTFGCANNQNMPRPEQQSWGSRKQSVTPTGNARLADNTAAMTPKLEVASSGNAHQTAAALLQQASKSPVAIFRANAVEALIYSPDDLRPIVRGLLADNNRGVRFVTAMAVGRSGLTEFVDALQPLLIDDSPSVRAAAIYALTKSGQKVDQTPLAAMARSEDPEIRSNAYLVLGELGNPSALPIIRESLGKGLRKTNPARVRIIELQAAEAMVRLGDQDQVEPIRAALFAPSGGQADQSEIAAFAAQIAGRLHDEGSRPLLVRLIDSTNPTGENSRPPEIRLTAAASLAELGVQDRAGVSKLAKAYIRDRDPIVRGQAAFALARAEEAEALPELERMLFDSDPSVQLAAAKAVLLATRRR